MRSLVAGLAAARPRCRRRRPPGPATAEGTAAHGLAPAATPAPPTSKVALIGDSTLLGLTYNPSAGRNSDARSVIAAKYDIVWGVASCQRLVAPSCGSNPPPTSLQQMQANAGQLGQALVIMGGYDDAEIGTGVDAIVAEAARQGVGTVLWLTYRTGDLTYQYASNYVGFNAVLRAKAQQYGSMVLADWDAYSHDHPEWMTDDGVHVNSTGRLRPGQLHPRPDRPADAVALRRRGRGRPVGGARRPSPRPPPPPASSRPRARSASSTPVRATATATTCPLGAGHAMKVPLHATGATAAAVNLTAVGPVRRGLPHRLPVRRRRRPWRRR